MGMNGLLPTIRIDAIDPEPNRPLWLVQDLWGACAVGVIGGAPKARKSMMGLDLAVSAASGTRPWQHSTQSCYFWIPRWACTASMRTAPPTLPVSSLS